MKKGYNECKDYKMKKIIMNGNPRIFRRIQGSARIKITF